MKHAEEEITRRGGGAAEEKLVSWHRLAHIFRFIERQAELQVVVVVVAVVIIVFLVSFLWLLLLLVNGAEAFPKYLGPQRLSICIPIRRWR